MVKTPSKGIALSGPSAQNAAASPNGAAWRQALPTLNGKQVILREVQSSDAPSLFALLTTPEVSRFLLQPPDSVEGLERFIAWAQRQRAEGLGACFAVTLAGFDTAVGIFQLRGTGLDLAVVDQCRTAPDFSFAEWGFALGSPFWGTGVFQEGANLVLEFAFNTLGVHRLEASAAVRNGRGNRALLKVGAVQEGVLRRSLLCQGRYLDEALYAIVEDDWRVQRQRELPVDPVQVH